MLTRADRDAAYNNNAVVSAGEQITECWGGHRRHKTFKILLTVHH
jgi:hypothetical protein